LNEGKQMTGAVIPGAPSHLSGDWTNIVWSQCYREVKKLQIRIVKAWQQKRWGKVNALQRLLTHSYSAKALAVRRVTENQGKNTPGVDGVTWPTPSSKTQAIETLKLRSYRPLPLKRVYIPKKKDQRRALGIPGMKNRAMQVLHLLSLEPIAEALILILMAFAAGVRQRML